MRGILQKFTFTQKPPITDDEYRESVAGNATSLLSKLFESAQVNLTNIESMKILVIGSGFFPSFMPLVNVLFRHAPNLSELHFVLVEPLKSETDRFQSYFSKIECNSIGKQASFYYSAHNNGIKEYLLSHPSMIYDLIYFEQPDLSPIDIFLAKKGQEISKLIVSIRESIPYLKWVIKPNTIILASNLFKRDLLQLNSLLNFSLRTKSHIEYLPRLMSDGAPYSSGLISVIRQDSLSQIQPEIKSAAIKRNDDYYVFALFISFIILLLTPSFAKILSCFFTIGLFTYHRYCVRALIFKLALIAGQLTILVGSIIISHAISF